MLNMMFYWVLVDVFNLPGWIPNHNEEWDNLARIIASKLKMWSFPEVTSIPPNNS